MAPVAVGEPRLPIRRRRAMREAIDWSQLPGPATAEVSYFMSKSLSSTPKGAFLCTPGCTFYCRMVPMASEMEPAGWKLCRRLPSGVCSGGLYDLCFSKAALRACWWTLSTSLRDVV